MKRNNDQMKTLVSFLHKHANADDTLDHTAHDVLFKCGAYWTGASIFQTPSRTKCVKLKSLC